MIKKEGINSISTQLFTNNKPILDTITSEHSLHIKNRFRSLRDSSTDGFVKTMFAYDYFNNNEIANNNNEIRRNLFLLYVYDYFNLKIISDFEYYLLTNNFELLESDTEYIHFLFKGGNIYFHIVRQLIDIHHIFDGLDDVNVNIIKNMFNDSFKISDFDFTINLYCNSHQKFLKIKEQLVKFITEKLEEITLFFNQLIVTNLLNSPLVNNIITDNTHTFTANNVGIINPNQQQLINQHYNLNTQSNIDFNIIIVINQMKNINNIFTKLYNNIFFKPFLNAVSKNTNNIFGLGVILGGLIDDNITAYYGKLISNFEITKVQVQINNIIRDIRNINYRLNGINWDGLNVNLNKEYNAHVINTLSKLIYINDKYINIFRINNNFSLQLFKTALNNHFKNLEYLFNDINFYSDLLFIDMVKNIAENLTNKIYKRVDGVITEVNKFVKEPNETFMFNNDNDFIDESNYEVIKLTNNLVNPDDVINYQDIELVGAPNLIIQKDNHNTELYINSVTNNFHYVSYNSTIYSVLNTFGSIISFDLLRSKLHFKLNNVYVKKFLPDVPDNWTNNTIIIPSEFIDISIGCYEDSFYDTFTKDPNFYVKSYNYSVNNLHNVVNSQFNIKSLSVEYFIHDLTSILFSQNIFYPWYDNKYNKRIKRLLFLYIINKNTNANIMMHIQNITNLMIMYIDNPNYNYFNNNNMLGDLQNYSQYNCTTFNNFAQHVIDNHISLKSHHFAHNSLYFNDISELINCLFFCFYIYNLYNRNIDGDREIAINLINSQRKLYKFKNLNNIDYVNLYHNKIPEFIREIDNSLTEIIYLYLNIALRLPNYI